MKWKCYTSVCSRDVWSVGPPPSAEGPQKYHILSPTYARANHLKCDVRALKYTLLWPCSLSTSRYYNHSLFLISIHLLILYVNHSFHSNSSVLEDFVRKSIGIGKNKDGMGLPWMYDCCYGYCHEPYSRCVSMKMWLPMQQCMFLFVVQWWCKMMS